MMTTMKLVMMILFNTMMDKKLNEFKSSIISELIENLRKYPVRISKYYTKV